MDCVSIIRYNRNEKQTIGRLVYGDFECDTLELAWKKNQNSISCIPLGTYKVSRRYSAKYGWHFILHDVKDRNFILIHIGNYYTQTHGCILVGNGLKDVNKDGFTDVLKSHKTMAKLLEILPKEDFCLEISIGLMA